MLGPKGTTFEPLGRKSYCKLGYSLDEFLLGYFRTYTPDWLSMQRAYHIPEPDRCMISTEWLL